MNANLLNLPAIALLLAAGTAAADVSLSTGVEYSSGTYGGTEDIEDVYVPVSFAVRGDRVGLFVTVPYLSVRAPAGTVIDPDGQPIPGTGETTTESGLGDVIASLTVYDLYYNADADFAVDLRGSVKFGTADADKGLGTGENDLSLYLDAYRWFDRSTLFASAGYRWRGEPDGVTLDDAPLASIGGSRLVGRRSLLGIAFDYRGASLEGFDDVREITGFGSVQLGEDWYLGFYAFTGLTDSSPDWGGGLSITTQLRPLGYRDTR